MVKAIFFDVDGTLVSYENAKVPQSAKDAIQQLRKQGILCVLATGRAIMELDDLDVKDMEFDGYITLNGIVGFDKNKEMLWGVTIPEEDFKRGLEMFENHEMPMTFIEKDRFYNNFIDDTVIYAQQTISSPLMEIGEYTGNAVYQMDIFAELEMAEYLEKLFPNCTVIKWKKIGFDLVSKIGGKVFGIQKYCDLMNIALEDTMAFGDGGNDHEMLEYVHVGIAMGNASDDVKAVADYVTDSVDEDGILHALEHFRVL